MKTHNEIPGSPEWHARRAGCFNASDASAMLGCSPHETRSQLLARLHSGIHKEFSDFEQQRVIDPGHEFEAKAQPLAEQIVGDDLAPVGGSEDFGLSRPLGASFDGLTMMGDTAWEHKTLNAQLAALPIYGTGGVGIRATDLPKHYRVQMEQQMLASGATRVLFMASKWKGEELDEHRYCWYESDPALRAEILAGWRQFDADLATYTPSEIKERPSAEVTLALPALFIHAKGEITTSNMKEYGEALATRLSEVRAIQLVTDQDFSNAKESAKLLRENIQQAKLAKEAMLAQTVTVGEAARMIDTWCEDMRLTALKLEQDVEREDKIKKTAMIDAAKVKYAEHVRELEREIAPARISVSQPVFAEAIKNKRNFASMQDALDTMLAKAKIAANDQAATIRFNREQLRPQNGVEGDDWISLFPDFAAVCAKPRDDFHNLVTARVAAHRQKLEQERERIRREEQERADREAREKVQREQQNAAASAAAHALAESRRTESLPPELQTALEGVAADLTADLTIGRAANSSKPNVVPIAARGKPTLRLGDINSRIAPLAITEAGLQKLGFPAAGKDRSAVLFHEADFGAMCDSIVAHVRTAAQRVTEAEAA